MNAITDLMLTRSMLVNCSSDQPADIINKLLDTLKYHNNVTLVNCDVWRYSNSVELTDFFAANPTSHFYILTIGYAQEQVSPNVWEIAIPWPVVQALPIESPSFSMNATDSTMFSCLNNYSRYHRIYLGCKLWEQNLLDNMIYSQNWFEDSGFHGYDQDLINELANWDKFSALLPIQADEPHKDFRDDHSIRHQAYIAALYNIVSETEVQGIHPNGVNRTETQTEKTYKPFFAGQVPIFYASPGHIPFLESYGFNCFTDLLPTDYDSQGVHEKTNSIVDLVKSDPEYLKDYYFSHARELEDNFNIVNSNHLETETLARIKSLLNINGDI